MDTAMTTGRKLIPLVPVVASPPAPFEPGNPSCVLHRRPERSRAQAGFAAKDEAKTGNNGIRGLGPRHFRHKSRV